MSSMVKSKLFFFEQFFSCNFLKHLFVVFACLKNTYSIIYKRYTEAVQVQLDMEPS